MLLNENTTIWGEKVVLVPYRVEHVPTYHQWMKSPELLELTASEPLSYDEEIEMQRAPGIGRWHLDEDKLTFILLERPVASFIDLKAAGPETVRAYKMIGDVNLFLPDGPTGDIECEVMIAEASARKSGRAFEALSLLITYATTRLEPTPSPSQFLARISTTNTASIKLFEKLGFVIVKVVEVFNEVEMRLVEDRWRAMDLQARIGAYDP